MTAMEPPNREAPSADDLRKATSGKLIDALRRLPKTCLYCDAVADSKEHALQEALGGRLWAINLCGKHNGIVNKADEPFSKMFAPFMTMLQVSRQRGGVGAEAKAKDEYGAPITILGEGFVKQPAVEVLSRHRTNRKITRVRGDLSHLDRLPIDAMSPDVPHHVMAVVTNPEVVVEVESTSALSGAILKVALHFYSGFVGDVNRDVALKLLDSILDGPSAANGYVRTAFLDEDVFPEEEVARHEVTCYPYDDESCVVTLLLFGAYALHGSPAVSDESGTGTPVPSSPD